MKNFIDYFYERLKKEIAIKEKEKNNNKQKKEAEEAIKTHKDMTKSKD
jgi:predicted RND superfamily exporter protein